MGRFGQIQNPRHCCVNCAYAAVKWGQCNQGCACAAAENANAIEAELSYD